MSGLIEDDGRRLCSGVLALGTYFEPPEYCDNDPQDGSDYCARCDPDHEPDWDPDLYYGKP